MSNEETSQKKQNDIIENVPLNERQHIGERVAEDMTKEGYEFMPVESFGNFLIKKMGFDEKVGIGKKQQIVRPIEFVPRNHRQGLGADPMPSFLQKTKDGKPIPKELQNLVSATGKNYNYIGDKMIDKNRKIQINDQVEIIKGKHEDLQGFITKVDHEKEEYHVELKNGQIVKVDKKEIKLIIQELEQNNNNNNNKRSHSNSSNASNSNNSDSNDNSDSDDDKDKKREKKSKKIKKSDKKSKKDKKDKKDKKSKKKSNKDKDKEQKQQSNKKRSLKWVEMNIRIRIINKKYKDGKYYNIKGIISDILDRYTFTVLIQTNNNNQVTLDDLTEDDIETIIPDINKKVKVLIGDNKGYIATLLERNKRKNEVVVQIVDTMDTIVLSQDDISEVVGM